MSEQYELRRTCLGFYSAESYAATLAAHRHCPDCGDHTRPMLIRGRAEGSNKIVGSPVQLFVCDRCQVAFMISYDPCEDAALEASLPEIMDSIRPDSSKKTGLFR
ncbi:MAG: hypothetical protein EPO21_14765 [Chloroflexota bacterium]|nr:MAG: hypothetical protein EPO21_14765 [Chloroflexota bacterium]